MEEDKINTIIKDLEGKDVTAINEMIAEYVSLSFSPSRIAVHAAVCSFPSNGLWPPNLEKQGTTLLPERRHVTAHVHK